VRACLPGLSATLALAAPDRMRVRASALLGITVDLLVARDSVWAWVPSERLAFAAPSESLGVADPAALAARVVGATWNPPPEAWRAAVADSAGWSLGWREDADTLAMDVDRDGRPVQVWMGREGRGLRVRYDEWMSVRGERFPARCQLADDSGWARVRLRFEAARAASHPDDAWFAPRRMAATRTLGWEDLRAAFQRDGAR
jgi:hypothetical protein